MAKLLPMADHPRSRRPAGSARRDMPRAAVGGRPAEPPAHGVPPRLIGLAASMVVVFLLAIGFFATGNPVANFNLLGIAGFAVIFFTLTLGLSSRVAHDRRWTDKGNRRARSTLGGSAGSKVAIATGDISGRAAMVQILVLPVTLATGMVVLGLIFTTGL